VTSKQTKRAYVATHSLCVLSRGNHPLYKCKQFRKASSQQRLNLIKQNQLCFICLGNSHRTAQCKVEWRCKFCSRKHNSLLPCESKPAQKNSRNDCNRSNYNLDQQLQRFWEIQELPDKTWTAEEIFCEEHFKKHTARDDFLN